MPHESSTATARGGLLEKLLSRLRANMADRLIPSALRAGRVLDLGCGEYPFFLLQTDFKEKVGLDRLIAESAATKNIGAIQLFNQDIEKNLKLPFPDGHFEAVTFLAAFEHIEPVRLPELHNEIHRVLKKGGIYVMTTPARWADSVLRILAKFHLVDAVLFAEHKDAYTHQKITAILNKTHFRHAKIRRGAFELGMNLWLAAEKTADPSPL